MRAYSGGGAAIREFGPYEDGVPRSGVFSPWSKTPMAAPPAKALLQNDAIPWALGDGALQRKIGGQRIEVDFSTDYVGPRVEAYEAVAAGC